MRLIVEKSQDPYHNLAMEEALFAQASENILYLWRNRSSVIVGRHQNTAAEIDRQYVTEQKIPVVRRMTGGGAVYHDPGNVNISFILTGADFDVQVTKCVRLLTDFLADQGVQAEWTGRNDICVRDGDRPDGSLLKIAGTAQTLRQGRGIFHSCLLFDTDREAMARALTPPPDKLVSKGIASVRSRTVNLKETAEGFGETSADEFFYQTCEYFRRVCAASGTAQDQEDAALALMEKKYLTWEWNYGQDPKGNLENDRRFPIGRVELAMSVYHGRIQACRFTGDYLTDFDLQRIGSRLCGAAFDEAQIETVLNEFDIEGIFHIEDRREFLDFLLGRRQYA